ncbi:AraC family transcriptional regulator [Edaphobacter acidisoli]|uniref:AraC family transcriptional regulator n=1 Tax=Edaphobacter acidisoli TaxID=2040573 RepID=A0A916W2F9_9BACT|nr:AraC family transcriptional regulator [Edaphobacter acidisoli]GGA60723.1 AraC family transcriptional regulator [Edaphobacter acidisoli]
MYLAGKALWFIESHYGSPITLDDIAAHSGVSRFHMARAFESATGQSVMRYVRSRRLTEAARALANGAPDILSVALDAGYNSHEAFTRAFCQQFGLTPQVVRVQKNLNDLNLTEPLNMNNAPTITVEPTRFELSLPMLIAGLGDRFTVENHSGIPSLWQRFGPHIGHVPGQVGGKAYGIVHNFDEDGNFDYIAGVEVSDFNRIPSDFQRIRIPEQRYAVFTHRDHVSTIGQTCSAIWNSWLPQSGHQVADAPTIELYGEDFNPATGTGLIEVWFPVKA